MDYEFITAKIESPQPVSLNFLIGFSYYYNGKMELMLSKEFSVSNVTRFYQLNYMPAEEHIMIIPPEDLNNLSVVIVSKQSTNDGVNYPNFYKRFGVQPIDIIKPMIQRALFCNPFRSRVYLDENKEAKKIIYSKPENCKDSDKYKNLMDKYPRNIVNRELFIGAKFISNNVSYNISYSPFKDTDVKYSEKELNNIFKLPGSIQKTIDKYKKANDPQMEFDFGE